MNFDHKIVLITGGSRGIGKAITSGFADRGARVAINYRSNDASAQAFLETLSDDYHRLFKYDIGKIDQCKALVEAVHDHFGRIDVLVNNAGIHEQHPIDVVDYDNWNRIFEETLETNLLGPARLMYLTAQIMKDQDSGGRIVNVSSRGAFRGEPDQPAYGASKAGLNALSQSLAKKLAPYGVTVGVVAPGFVDTEMVNDLLNGPVGDQIRDQSPFKRVAKPEEVAYATMFLASEESTFCSGAILDVNGASYLRS